MKHHRLCNIIILSMLIIIFLIIGVLGRNQANSFDTYSKACYADSTAERVYVVWGESKIFITGVNTKGEWDEFVHTWACERELNRNQYLNGSKKLLYSYVKYNHRQPTADGYINWKRNHKIEEN